MRFNSQICMRGSFVDMWTNEQIKNEPMFFNCDLAYAAKNGGPITRAFIDALPEDWAVHGDVVLDSRVHMLMPGWTPCIPGWHHDDVPRSTRDGQPNYTNPEYHAEHLMGLVNGGIAPTMFALGKIEVPTPVLGTVVYEQWSKSINAQLKQENPGFTTADALSGKLIQFDCDTFHTGVPAVASGWRWFVRLSRNTERTKSITNELRRQVQVYMEFPEQGW